MEEWRFPAAYDQDYLPDPDQPVLVPAPGDDGPGRARRRRPGAPARGAASTPTTARRSTSASGTRWSSTPADVTTWRPSSRSRWCEGGAPAVADRRAAVRRLLCAPRVRDPPHPRHVRAPRAPRPAFAIGRRDWEVIADNHARILWGMGVRPGDTRVRLRAVQPLPRFVGRDVRRRAAALPRAARSAPARRA